jgi:hypothetical protein
MHGANYADEEQLSLGTATSIAYPQIRLPYVYLEYSDTGYYDNYSDYEPEAPKTKPTKAELARAAMKRWLEALPPDAPRAGAPARARDFRRLDFLVHRARGAHRRGVRWSRRPRTFTLRGCGLSPPRKRPRPAS